MKVVKLSVSVLAGALVLGCVTTNAPKGLEADANETMREAREMISASTPNVSVVDAPYVDPTPIKVDEYEWLRRIPVSITEPKGAISARELVRALNAQGVEFSWQLPLGSYYYTGAGISDTDALTAMTVLFSSMGLGFKVNTDPNYVTITPMKSRTWDINIGNRSTSYGSELLAESGNDDAAAGGGAGAGGAGGGAGGQGGVSGLTALTGGNEDTTTTSVNSDGEFWGAIEAELTERMTVLVPVASEVGAGGVSIEGFEAPGRQAQQQRAQAALASSRGGGELFEERTIGRFSVNPATGAITVQAPDYVLDQVGDYIEGLSAELNTVLEFEGRLVLVSSTRDEAKGLDLGVIAGLASSRFDAIVSNNALGGVTISPPNLGGLIGAAPNALTQSVVGGRYVGSDTIVQAFLGYLEQHGDVKTVQKPFLSTSSGVPVSFSQNDRTYVNLISENTTLNQTTAQTTRTNNLIPFQFGTSLRLNPQYDAIKDVVRTQISITQILRSGILTIDQVVSNGNGTQVINTDIPLDRTISYQGETLLKDGALVVVGGQTLQDYRSNSSGVTGLKDSPVGAAFGKSSENEIVSTYYFLLSVRVKEPDRGLEVASK
ncbi:MAG: hypothetical protein RJQ08_03545 [Salinisphaeraceae bacterium]